MNLLCIDTSGPICGVAVLRDGTVAYEATAVNRMTHSVSLMPMIEEALNQAELEIPQIDSFAAVTGPGSFTGVRIGVSVIKGLAHGANKPCIGVNALEALAGGISLSDALLCPLQDARAGGVYAAAFLSGDPLIRVLPDSAEKLDAFLEKALAAADGRKLCFTGDGLLPHRAEIIAKLGNQAILPPAHLLGLRPASAALIAASHREDAVDYLTLMPVYLRAPSAQLLSERLRGASV